MCEATPMAICRGNGGIANGIGSSANGGTGSGIGNSVTASPGSTVNGDNG